MGVMYSCPRCGARVVISHPDPDTHRCPPEPIWAQVVQAIIAGAVSAWIIWAIVC